jgi:hypothetical protein
VELLIMWKSLGELFVLFLQWQERIRFKIDRRSHYRYFSLPNIIDKICKPRENRFVQSNDIEKWLGKLLAKWVIKMYLFVLSSSAVYIYESLTQMSTKLWNLNGLKRKLGFILL